MGYSGNANFQFEIERYKNNLTGEIILSENYPDDAGDDDFEYQVISLDVEGAAYYSEGRTGCHPDDAFPPEGDNEIISVLDGEGKDWQPLLSKYEVGIILEMIVDRISSPDDSWCESHDPYEAYS